MTIWVEKFKKPKLQQLCFSKYKRTTEPKPIVGLSLVRISANKNVNFEKS